MGTADFKYNWRKMEATAQDCRAGGRQVVVAYAPAVVTRLKSSSSRGANSL